MSETAYFRALLQNTGLFSRNFRCNLLDFGTNKSTQQKFDAQRYCIRYIISSRVS